MIPLAYYRHISSKSLRAYEASSDTQQLPQVTEDQALRRLQEVVCRLGSDQYLSGRESLREATFRRLPPGALV